MLKMNEDDLESLEESLREEILSHFQNLGITSSNPEKLETFGNDKNTIRSLHRIQREERIKSSIDLINRRSEQFLQYFASGNEIVPETITPKLERVYAGKWQSELFRFASLTWSVPVSRGYGRRLRFLVWDKSNGKLIGLIALGDPVFNLNVRDNHIGWNLADRTSRLVNIMDAYVLGALPPYNSLLSGKMIACLVRSKEIYNEFKETYGDTIGIISGEKKRARLLAVTTSSSMGRSSVYNRLKLNDIHYFQSLGYTQGWGHFHIPDYLFLELREYLRKIDHKFSDYYRYGQGSNWRLNCSKAAINSLGFKVNLLRHGIKREVFFTYLAKNSNSILLTGKGKPELTTLLNVNQISNQSKERWIIPRSKRRPEYQNWNKSDLLNLIIFNNSSTS